MSMHDHHNHCDHKLRYCRVCDAVYCKSCSREWKNQQYNWTYTSPITVTTSNDWTAATTPVVTEHLCEAMSQR